MKKQPLLKFPCEFNLKVIGKKSDPFEIDVLAIIKKHVKHLKENAIKQKTSKGNKYLALTITFKATSKKQLDKIYTELNQSEHVVMTL